MICPVCASEFTPRTSRHRFCSDKCQEVSSFGCDLKLDNGPVRTLAEVGAELGVSRSRIDQIEKGALAKLRGLGLRREDWL